MNKIFTGSTLKILAVISMLTDHFGQIILKNGLALNAPYSMFTDKQFKLLLSAIEICHILGRIAFPVFCFLVVEGFLHTHSLKKYLLHLGMFAIFQNRFMIWLLEEKYLALVSKMFCLHCCLEYLSLQ